VTTTRRELFEANLALIDRVIGRIAAKGGLAGADAEDFASEVRIALMADDFAILAQWEGRSSLATYLTVIVQRLLTDARRHRMGKWRPTAEAQRLGELGVRLETLVRRDGRSLDDALPLLHAIDPSLTRARAAELLARLPERMPRAHTVALAETDLADAHASADEAALAFDARKLSVRTSGVMREALAKLPTNDRLMVDFRFGSGMTIAEISRILGIPQRPLYRRFEAVLRELRRTLHAADIDARTIEELIGSPFQQLDFLDERKSGDGVPSLEEEKSS
jgi:RNA polymerase sigma factor (sigma-70 family)